MKLKSSEYYLNEYTKIKNLMKDLPLNCDEGQKLNKAGWIMLDLYIDALMKEYSNTTVTIKKK